ncbi:MAG: CotH kinase family protein [Kofleriaceae bacterium]
MRGPTRPATALMLALLVTSCGREPSLYERIYGLQEIPTFRISLLAEARAALAERPREWVHGGFSYKSTNFPDVGVRLKGHRSLRKLGAKPSFKVKFDRFVPTQKLAKQKSLTLNNMIEDPSMMREVLAYRLFRALGVAAPDAGFAEVEVDGEPQGLYAVIEGIDKKFLKRRFKDPNGPVYEGEWGCDVVPDDVSGFSLDRGSADRTALSRFAAVAQGDAATLFGATSPLDVEAFLRFLAVDMYVGNFDGYRHGHNYRLYYEPTKQRWYFIPWGLDRTFVKDLSIYNSHGYLAKRCFADPVCRARYVRTMRAVVAEARRLKLEQGVDVIAVITADAVARDPRGQRAEAARKARDELRQFLVERPDDIERELGCLAPDGTELDRDGDGFGCLDCDDRNPVVHPGVTEVCDGVDNDCDRLADNAACGCQTIDAAGLPLAACNLPMPYLEAQEICKARGQTLAWFDNEAQARAAHTAVRTLRKDKWWLGLDDRVVEGTFRRLGHPDEQPAFVFWDRGEPDNAGCNQDCAVIDDADDARWTDTHCLEHRPFLCR